jgi:predicted phosphodiesterase
MRIGVVSDSHGCLIGLQTVVEWLEIAGVDRIVCAGDIASFGPRPNECIDFLRARAIPTVQGNEDLTMAHPQSRRMRTERIAEIEAIEEWGRARLSDDNRRWLAALPKTIEPVEGLLVVHAAPGDQTRIVTADDEPVFPDGIEAVAAGHLHHPFVKRTPRGLWVNVGSVARPCDGDPRASCATLECHDGIWDAQIFRIPFDLMTAVANIRKAGMPYAEKLVQTQLEARWW